MLLALASAMAPLECQSLSAAPPGVATPQILAFNGQTMGTQYTVKCWAPLTSTPPIVQSDALQRLIDDLLEQIDRQMSTYRDDSELSRFNRAPHDVWHPVSPATALVVEKALALHRLTDGTLDVTLGPLSRLWRFGPEGGVPGRDYKLPSEQQLLLVRALCGAEKLTVRRDPPALRKSTAGLEVDLSSIAPGYAVDAVLALLQERGFSHALVDIGGEVAARGTRADGEPWQVGIEAPWKNSESEQSATTAPFTEIVSLDDRAMATSGDYRNFRTLAGKRYAHILDPQSGRPIPYRGISVTVLADSCMEADALATALFAMPETTAYSWCERHEVAALFHLRGGADQSPQVLRTPSFVARRSSPGK